MPSFTQVNLHKAEQATSLLAGGLQGKAKEQNVLLITEPHLVAGKIAGMPRGTKTIAASITPSKRTPGPRAGIVVTRDLQVQAMDSLCQRDCAVALARLHGREVLLISAYLDINLSPAPQCLADILNIAQRKKWPIILGIDSNAHSSLYGPGENNKRGDEFEDFILRHDLRVENFGTAPTFETRRADKIISTHIDVTLSRDLPFDIQDWRVSRDFNGSDHNTILFSSASAPPTSKYVRPWSKADWPLFTSSLSEADYQIPGNVTMKKLDRHVARLYSILNEAIDKACPLISVTDRVPDLSLIHI